MSLPARAAALGAALLLALPAAAQTSQGTTQVSARLTLVGNASPCLQTTQAGAHDVSASCTGKLSTPTWGCPELGPYRDAECKYIEPAWTQMDSVWGRVRASNTNGQLRVSTDLVVETMLQPSSTPGAANGYVAEAKAEWADRLDLGAVPRADSMLVAFDLYAHGEQWLHGGMGNLPGAINHDTWTRYTFAFDMNTRDQDSHDWFGQQQLQSTGPADADRMKSLSLLRDTTITRWVKPNERYLDFAYSFRSESRVPSAVQASNTNYVVWSRVSGDFGNTAGLRNVRFYGADGATPLENVQYQFVNGTQFVGPATTVPEPQTVTLLAAGLLAIGGAVRRRRAATVGR